MPEENNQQPFHDVNRPGQHPSEPTSRPIIVGHRPTMPDPMVNQRPMHHQPAQPPAPRPAHHPMPPSRAPQPIDGFTATPPQHHAPVNHSAPTEPSSVAGEPLQSPPFDGVSHQSHIPTSYRHQVGHHEDIQSTDHGTVHGMEHSPHQLDNISGKRFKWWAPLAVLLGVIIILYLLIDAGVIHTGINLPFHLFHQETGPVYTPNSTVYIPR